MWLSESPLSPGLGRQVPRHPRGQALLWSTAGRRSVGPVKRRGFRLRRAVNWACAPLVAPRLLVSPPEKTETDRTQDLLLNDVYIEGRKKTLLDLFLLGFGAFINRLCTFPASICCVVSRVARLVGRNAAVVGGAGLGGSDRLLSGCSSAWLCVCSLPSTRQHTGTSTRVQTCADLTWGSLFTTQVESRVLSVFPSATVRQTNSSVGTFAFFGCCTSVHKRPPQLFRPEN